MGRYDLTDLSLLDVTAESASVVDWQGRRALRLENGVAFFKDTALSEARLEVCIATAGSAYPGIAFRAADARNMELVYAQPHTSGLWDALQYDPVFQGANTWQVYNGPRYQKQAEIPTGRWFRLRVDLVGQRAAITVDEGGAACDQPLVIGRLAHDRAAGRLGVWTYLPAYFADFRVAAAPERLPAPSSPPLLPPGMVGEWLLEGCGPVRVEENGSLNLNRYLDQTLVSEAVVCREFIALRQGPLAISLGYSDEVELSIDRRQVFAGANKYSGIGASRRSRGYVEPGTESLLVQVAPGRHLLSARVRATEPFGWGLSLALAGDGIELLPTVG
ncbi:MAG: hypothetical protein ACM3XN_09750 [Chloroflexota bacterium]